MPVEIPEIGGGRDEPGRDDGTGLTRAAASTVPRPPRARAGDAWFGVYPGVVADRHDRDDRGHVGVSLPWALGSDGKPLLVHARLAMPMAGDRRGTWFPPEVGDEVLLAFEGGDLRRPYVIGALWNGVDRPPVDMASGAEADTRLIRSPRGLEVALVDTLGHEHVRVRTPGGQTLTLEDHGSSVEIAADGGSRVRVTPHGVDIATPGKVSLTGSVVEVGGAVVKVNAATVTFSGTLTCSSIVATSVVAQSYTNGAGNVW